MTDYCECGYSASLRCRQCRTPTCNHHRGNEVEVPLGRYQHSAVFRPHIEDRCPQCTSQLLAAATQSSAFGAFALGQSAFETACRIAAWDRCLFEILDNHEAGSACCPQHWTSNGFAVCAPYQEITFKPLESIRGLFFDGLTFKMFASEFLQAATQRGIAPSIEISVGYFRKVAAFDFFNGLYLGADGMGYAAVYHGRSGAQLSEESISTPIVANGVLRAKKGRKEFYAHPGTSRDLLANAHRMLRGLPPYVRYSSRG